MGRDSAFQPAPDTAGQPIDAEARSQPAAAGPVEPLDKRARVAIGLIALVGLTALAALWADLGRLDLANRVLDGDRVRLSEAQQVDDRTAVTSIVYVIATVLSGIAFLLWYSRAYRNTLAMGVIGRWKPGWAVAYWFIPLMNLFRPKQVMNDIWRGSDPRMANPAGTVHFRPTTPLLWAWWLAWLVSVFAANFATGSLGDLDATQTAEEFRDSAIAYVVADITDVIAALLAIAVVVALTRRQQARIEIHSGGAAHEDPFRPPPEPAVSST